MPVFEKPLRVLIVSSSEKGVGAIESLLSCEGPLDVAFSPDAGSARRMLLSEEFDIAVVNSPLSDENGLRLSCELSSSRLIQTLLLVKSEHFDEVSGMVEDDGVLTVQKPVSKALLHQAFKLAVAGSRRAGALINENRKLLLKLDEIKLVERAKWTLIGQGMTEEQAHRHIEKRAMDLRMARADVARDILKSSR